MSKDIIEEVAAGRMQELLNEFLNLAINRFSWENLPFGLTSEQLEKLLITKGQLMYYKDNELGEILLPCNGTTDINPYGLPTTYRVNAENGKHNKDVDIDEGVLLKNNPLGTADYSTLLIFAKRIDDTERTQDVNLFQQNMPKIILADTDSKLTAQTVIEKLKNFKLVIFGKKSLVTNVTSSDVLDTSAPYILDKLQQQKTEYKNELLTYLGINTVNIMKKERVNTEEVNANNDYTETNIDLMYDMRVKFCEEVKKKFGKDIKVKKREVTENVESNNDPGTTN